MSTWSKRLRYLLGAVLFASMPLVAPLPAGAQGRLGTLPDFTDLYERQGPAVVSIDVTQKAKRQRFPDISEDDPFYEFFRRFGQIPRNGPGGGGGGNSQQRE